LHQHHKYQQEWTYLFDKDMQVSGINDVILDLCMFLHREIFHAQGDFFDKNDTLAEFSQLYNYERFGI
jgi:hypothetical protein